VIWAWDSDARKYRTAFFFRFAGSPFDWKWFDQEAEGESTLQFESGAGFWYLRRPAEPAVWICHKPY
jgi:hypothetical protein